MLLASTFFSQNYDNHPVFTLLEKFALYNTSGDKSEWATYFQDRFRLPISTYGFFFPKEWVEIDDIEKYASENNLFPSTHHLVQGIILGFVISLLRFALDHLLFFPLGKWLLEIELPNYIDKAKDRGFLHSPTFLALEQKKTESINRLELNELASKAQMDPLELREYIKEARSYDKGYKKLVKFKEACWRDLIYACCIFMGYIVLSGKEWPYDLSHCWVGWPIGKLNDADFIKEQPDKYLFDYTAPMYWYYALQLGVYTHLSVYQFVDTKRSDFWEMFVHHIVTIALIVFSYCTGFIRIGCILMLTHDVSDVFLESAKIFNYIAKVRQWAQPFTDILFLGFAIVFFISRLIYFPFYIIHSTFTTPLEIIPHDKNLVTIPIFHGLLLILQALHIFWFYLIARLLVKVIAAGKVEKDERSDDEEEIHDYIEESDKKKSSKSENKPSKKIAQKKKKL